MIRSFGVSGAVGLAALLLVVLSTRIVQADPIVVTVEGTAATGTTADFTFQVHDEDFTPDPAPDDEGGNVTLTAIADPDVGKWVSGVILDPTTNDECALTGIGTQILVGMVH
jgi:hypothetical protein